MSKAKLQSRIPSDLLYDEVDLVISKQVVINADIRFKRLLRIDGRFEGKLVPGPEANIVVTRKGHYLGDIIGLNLAYIDGKVEGDIAVHFLELGPHANICGNILCKRIIVAGHARYTGDVKVSQSNAIPPPPQPSSDNSPVEERPEQPVTYEDHHVVKELHLVEDDDQACAPHLAASKEGDDSTKDSPISETKAQAPPRKSTILFVFEPQLDLAPDSALWSKRADGKPEKGSGSINILSNWIVSNATKIDHIVVLLDIHYRVGVHDQLFWQRSTVDDPSSEGDHGTVNQHPPVGAVITASDLAAEVWMPTQPSQLDKVRDYLQYLESTEDEGPLEDEDSTLHHHTKGIVIHPRHCQIGSAGAAVVPVLQEALSDWSSQRGRNVEYMVAQHDSELDKIGQKSAHLYDFEQLQHFASSYDSVFLAGQIRGHCHGTHLVQDIGGAITESLGAQDKEITVLTDALLHSGGDQGTRDEVFAAAQMLHVLLSTTEECGL